MKVHAGPTARATAENLLKVLRIFPWTAARATGESTSSVKDIKLLGQLKLQLPIFDLDEVEETGRLRLLFDFEELDLVGLQIVLFDCHFVGLPTGDRKARWGT